MEICEINIDELYVSDVNARKTLTSDEDETGISDLANDIRENGLINPITVRKNNDKYEIIAGQRRYLAMKLLKREKITCSIIEVDTQKAEEISLVENVQRNQMTTSDKVRSYSRLYNVYEGDIEKVISAIHISRPTIQKYLKISKLPEEILNLLDTGSENKITIDVAIELTKLPKNINFLEVLDKINTLTNVQKIEAIKQFKLAEDDDIDILDDIKQNIILEQNILIPENVYDEIVRLIKELIKEKTKKIV